MNPLETFGEFSGRLNTTDLMLYAGVAVVLWVLFKDKLGGMKNLVGGLISKVKSNVKPSVIAVNRSEDLFFDLVSAWKNLRDLASKSGCEKAVQAADEMFPYLSPVTCEEKTDEQAASTK